MTLERISFMGILLDPWTMEETVAQIDRRLDAKQFTQHAVVNVAKVVNIQRDASLRDAVLSCDIVNVDGMGVVLGGRFLRLHIPERVAGIDLFFNLLALASNRNESVFLLGAEPVVIKQAILNLRKRYPCLKIAGWQHGYFWDNEQAVVDAIRESGAALLFVGITSPKKEQFINRHRENLGVKFVMGVGGTFDIVAGKTARAPTWMQRVGLEWFFRILQEPRRMWRRYLITNTKYACMLVVAKLGGLKRG